MTQPSQSPSNFVQRLSRETLVLLLATAYDCGSYRFLRQSALAWLTIYPGDLGVNLWLAKALLAENKRQQAQPILEKLCRLDPEYSEALEILAKVSQETSPRLANEALANAHAVGIKGPQDVNVPNWIRLLRRARLLLQNGNIEEAEKMAAQVLSSAPDSVLAAILQMQLASARKDPAAVVELADSYHSQWPDCLQFALFQAEAQLENGDEAAAVNLLHKCVVNDSAAQVPIRIWGEQFAYRPLWPEPLEIKFDLPVPADVAGRLGWNLLPAAFDQTPAAEIHIVEPSRVDLDAFYVPCEGKAEKPPADDEPVFPFLERLIIREEAKGPAAEGADQTGSEIGTDAPWVKLDVENGAQFAQPEAQPLQQAVNDSLRAVQDEFERVAKRLKMPGLGRADGRFPVYVIMSSEKGLSGQYGASTLAVLDKEMHKLADAIRKRVGWDAIVYYPDSPACSEKMGVNPVDAADPWKLKLSLADLDAALGKKGEMIGALLIAGGPEVIPFHHLPNPTDDMDAQIASDNPYATLDSNYFIPDWPVGRLPGEAGPDAGLLLEGVRKLVRYHSKHALLNRSRKATDFWQRVQVFLQERAKRSRNGSLGYTAAVWKRSSLAVYRTIGEAGSLMASPPAGSGSMPGHKAVSLAYYNLHGMVDAPEWYGQRDFTDPAPGPDYPVAISPKDLTNKGQAPEIIFSEACYGGHVDGKSEEQAMALKFLAHGALAMVGSTSAAYGSVTTPLIGADLLGNYFWKNLKAGSTVGDALMQAKVDLVREMNKRQGFLDGEDQKTLISFVLYGDPLVSLNGNGVRQQKSKISVRAISHQAVKTVSDQKEETETPQPVSTEMIKKVKGIVKEYLPGLENAEICLQQQVCCDSSTAQDARPDPQEKGRTVITLNQDVRVGQKICHQFARVTLNSKGKMVKLALTR